MSERLRSMISSEGRSPGAGRHVRIATRGSALALAQAEAVASRLRRLGASVERVVIKTQGDRDRGPFATMNGQGFFTKAVQDALIDGLADLAVHSHKDLPTAPVPELEIAAVPKRAPGHDVLLVLPDAYAPERGLIPLREGGTVGTSAARRRHQLSRLRPDLRLSEMRGNVPTRVDRLRGARSSSDEPALDALVIAAAGIERLALDLDGLEVVPLDPHAFLPAPAQGALALEIRRDDFALAQLLTDLHDLDAGKTVAAERGLMAMLDGGCQLALGAYAVLEPGVVRLRAYYEGATAEAAHPSAEGAAMMVFEALGRPQRRSDPATVSTGQQEGDPATGDGSGEGTSA